MPIPYAQAGVESGLATATCPECGEVFTGRDSKAAVHKYGVHYAEKHEVGVEEIVEALKAAGFDAYENIDLGPCRINVYAKGYNVHLTDQFNRVDGGWEAAADDDGEPTPLDDGPALNAPAADIVAWVVRVLKDLPRADGGRDALFSGEWLLNDEDNADKGYRIAYAGVVYPDGYWSGGVQWFGSLAVVEHLVAEQVALAEKEPTSDIGRMTIIKDGNGETPLALVTYEPADGEFYTQHFTPAGLVQVPSWTWHEVTENEDVIGEVIR